MNKNYNPLNEAELERTIDFVRTYSVNVGTDSDGSVTSIIGLNYRHMAVGFFVLHADCAGFRNNIKNSATLALSLCTRAEKGEAIARSYLSTLMYREVLDTFAGCEFELGTELVSCIGDEKVGRKFDNLFAYALKAVILKDSAEISKWLPQFQEICSAKHKEFLPYAGVLRAIVDNDVVAANNQFDPLVEGHKRQCRNGRQFGMTVDQELCVWGIGLANLCRWRGLAVEPTPPLIPGELLYEGESR